MQDNNKKYQDNPLGLSPALLGMAEALGRALFSAIKARDKKEVVDIEYEVVEENKNQLLLIQNTPCNDSLDENKNRRVIPLGNK